MMNNQGQTCHILVSACVDTVKLTRHLLCGTKAGYAGTGSTRIGQCQPLKFKICTYNSSAYEIFSRKQRKAKIMNFRLFRPDGQISPGSRYRMLKPRSGGKGRIVLEYLDDQILTTQLGSRVPLVSRVQLGSRFLLFPFKSLS